MKNLVTYIKESIETLNESNKELRFTPGDIEGVSDLIDTLKSTAQKNGIYVETVDGGVKFKGTDDNKEKFSAIADPIKKFVDDLKESDEEKNADAIEKIEKQLTIITDWMATESPKNPEDGEGE